MNTVNRNVMMPAIPIDGPRGYPLVGVIPAIWNNPLRFLTDTAQRYGEVARFRLGSRDAYLLCDPEGIGRILQRDKSADTISRFNHGMRSVFGEGLQTSRGELWREQRRILQPAFHRSHIDGLCPLIVDTTQEILARWVPVARTESMLDVAAEMKRLTSALSFRTMFDQVLDDQAVDEVTGALAVINQQLFFHLLLGGFSRLPTPGNRRFRRALATIDKRLWDIIDARMGQSPGAGDEDLLSMLMNANAQGIEGFSRAQLRDHLMTLLFAGQETSANALAWTFFLVAQHPTAEDRILQEVHDRLGDGLPTAATLGQLTYTRWVVQEAMRLYPPAYVLTPGVGPEGILIGRYLIPAGAQLIISQYVMHRHPKYWQDPDRFDPERFSKVRSAQRPKFVYFPFSGGPQTCLGAQLAMLQMTAIVAMVIRAYRLRLVPGHPVVPQASLTLRPRYGVQVKIAPRSGGSAKAAGESR